MAAYFETYSFTIADKSHGLTWTIPGNYYQKQKKQESKKEKIARIAKERMLASHKTYNQKTPSIIQVKQVCKPMHRIGGFRK